MIRNHRKYRRDPGYERYLNQTLDFEKIDRKIVALQSKCFLEWKFGPFTPITGSYSKPRAQMSIDGVVFGDDAGVDVWKVAAP